ncbi:hypothetical protein [Lacrimispora sp.]|uniref:hypothetical protein n=1 Tax=Lacrimispora sp. TaxID=2719234 RepID=UPI0029E74872|nr:hypothetical protein [Lacrimispora sp.]
MKKRLFGAVISLALTITMATPAFAEIIWTPDKLPAGYTTNEWENKDFSFYSGNAIKKDTYTYYVKDLHGNIMKNTTYANGSTTNADGVAIDANGHVCSFGSELAQIEFFNSHPCENITWHQNSSKSLNENGVSNYWYGNNVDFSHSEWRWLMQAPDGTENDLKYAYCFNEYGYLYTNTITPDGYMVNELGQLMIDGKVKTKETTDFTAWHGYSSYAIGYLVYDPVTSEQHKLDKPNPFF